MTENNVFEEITKIFEKVTEVLSKTPNVSDAGKAFLRAFEGGAIASFMNSNKFKIHVGGPRASNIVTVFDKTSISSLGNPKWFARVDMPHGNVPFHHINVNPAITGLPDPHIPISAAVAKASGFAGSAINTLNKASPILVAISAIIQIIEIIISVIKDFNFGTSRNTVKKIIVILFATIGGVGGSLAGAVVGTQIWPGIGTLIGGILGGVFGSAGLGHISDETCDLIMDYFKYDIHVALCKKCDKFFDNHRYRDGAQETCDQCR
ncbi:hypothetical protein B9Z55_011833 [Caenorhabditis nigoni]|uniref:Uncharacterized protein n=1 Tax=Caenorhabditis nigoni TaxID=1611254 RepID=A0A2G5UMF2_9PELO|nr:hypothetical protein B9Z55_011833 [Caenorhabditis nigoni]